MTRLVKGYKKPDVQEELEQILDSDVMLVLDREGGFFRLLYQYDAPISSEIKAIGATLSELIIDYNRKP